MQMTLVITNGELVTNGIVLVIKMEDVFFIQQIYTPRIMDIQVQRVTIGYILVVLFSVWIRDRGLLCLFQK